MYLTVYARKRRSLRNPPAKRSTLARQWAEYDAAVLDTYKRNKKELEWVYQGELWARSLAERARHNARIMDEIESRSFNPESDAADMWTDTITDEEASGAVGWRGVQIGYVNELERLTGRTFKRSTTTNAGEWLARWNAPMAQIEKMFERPRGARPNY